MGMVEWSVNRLATLDIWISVVFPRFGAVTRKASRFSGRLLKWTKEATHMAGNLLYQFSTTESPFQ
jgi:hypothetical protein